MQTINTQEFRWTAQTLHQLSSAFGKFQHVFEATCRNCNLLQESYERFPSSTHLRLPQFEKRASRDVPINRLGELHLYHVLVVFDYLMELVPDRNADCCDLLLDLILAER
ncbi:hypothetical protein NECAME_14457 [Necator americanus]|uniref:Uncharacterized protein n=1 Tax=Necator americanus TaxID=51031 RepID=W2SMZ4_NECAM|nr:hypothetical protein NECAME_14457 [Necator americanus]ETN70883.1 hypothetical protein NECAME_14457 [Necator americanus]